MHLVILLTLDDRRGLLSSVCVCLSVCAPFRPYNSKTIPPIELKFGGQVFHGVQTDSSKFGVICLKIKARREFFLFLIGLLQ